MSPEAVTTLAQQAMWTMFLVSAPILGVALVVGLLISLVQAATQLNEMTLTFVPKAIAIGLSLVFAGPWMLHVLMDFTTRLISSIPQLLQS
ncbi:flagellar biosynthetic protein FliQ [mine drainage metagenome]|jgi:flagellar biosynthetic protein FliQ|uniref:Flagellar biosynthetic protein FliQ n=1 Tax=mine drainage metagenome TaxID=410659 RepID=A0A1J5Q046_9ZZZZ